MLETKQLEVKEFFCMSLSEGVSSMPVMQVANECSSRVILDDEVSSGLVSFEHLVSMYGPDTNMQGVVMDVAMRSDMVGQEEMALGKMRHFCASILKKLAPPLLKEIESSALLRQENGSVTPRRVTRASNSVASPALFPR
jgi:hypothetical protein